MPYRSTRRCGRVRAHCEDGCWSLEGDGLRHQRQRANTSQGHRRSCLLHSLGCVPVACELPDSVLNSFPCVHVQLFKENKLCFSWTVETLWVHFCASIKLAFRRTSKLKSKSKFGQACFQECCIGGGFWTHLQNSKINSSTFRKAGHRLLFPGWPGGAVMIFVQVNLKHTHSVKEWGDMQQFVKGS